MDHTAAAIHEWWEKQKKERRDRLCPENKGFNCVKCGAKVEFPDDPSGFLKAEAMWRNKRCYNCLCL